ncbi:unnamed protein product [Polarella glacialis]|uniref:GrpE protein homolog n=1 Tax=Polarella glacialis TaxID=89957 RepID=A0A813HL45_POLGL|nr:unnamed protein product [Polarella glacialis]|mmetsp:Transcript_48939/g.79419  ORF Transcript_48939/g.79419 Transcript_48939/m.79419 type:complete len:227 (+) Transcript_48939:85-765(+)
MLSRVAPAQNALRSAAGRLTRQVLCREAPSARLQVAEHRCVSAVFFSHAPARRGFSTEAAAEEAPDLEELKAKIAEAQDQLQMFEEKLKSSRADIAQATKRHQTDLENETKYGFTKFAQNLLHIPDNLERAIDSVKTDELDESEELRKEVEAVKKVRHTVEQALEKFGVVKMKALDDTFNPERHEAMFAMEMPGKEPNQIFHVMESGYMIHDRVLRAAKVGIAKAA